MEPSSSDSTAAVLEVVGADGDGDESVRQVVEENDAVLAYYYMDDDEKACQRSL